MRLSEDGADAAAMFDHLARAFINHGPETVVVQFEKAPPKHGAIHFVTFVTKTTPGKKGNDV